MLVPLRVVISISHIALFYIRCSMSRMASSSRWSSSAIISTANLFAVIVGLASFTESVDVRDATVGLPVTLPCNLAEPTIKAMWFSPANQLLTNDYTSQSLDRRFSVVQGYQRERNLRISDVQLTDDGIYACKEAGTLKLIGEVRLRVNVPPTLQQSTDVTVVTGGDVTMTCRLKSGTPVPDIRWFFRGNRDESGLPYIGETLALKNVSRDQAGEYSCQADNGIPPFSRKTIRLDVKFAPILNLPERVLRQPPATNALLTCIVDANPPGDVYWQRDRDGQRPVVHQLPQPTPPGPASISPPSLISSDDAASSKFRVQTWPISRDGYTKLVGAFIENIGDSDLGSYTCHVRNDFGSAEVKLSIIAFNDSDITLPSSKESLQQGSSLNTVVVLGALLAFVSLIAVVLGVHVVRLRQQVNWVPGVYSNCRSTS